MATTSEAGHSEGNHDQRLLSGRRDSNMSLSKIEVESPDFLQVDPMETFANDYDRVQELLRQMIYDSKPITIDEKAELVSLLND